MIYNSKFWGKECLLEKKVAKLNSKIKSSKMGIIMFMWWLWSWKTVGSKQKGWVRKLLQEFFSDLHMLTYYT